MTEEKIRHFLQAIEGIKMHEWAQIKQKVDMHFSSKAAKVQLDDSSELKRNLEVEFNLRRFGEKQAAAGTANPQNHTNKKFIEEKSLEVEQIILKTGGYCKIDNVTEGYRIDGPAKIIIHRKIN